MKLIAYLTAVVVAAATLTTAAAAPSAGAAVRGTTPAPAARAAPATAPQHREWSTAELRDGRQAVAYFRGKAWSVQRRIPVPLTPTNYAERHTTSPAFLHWLKHHWNAAWHLAQHRLAAHLLPYTGDWATAVRIVQRVWPGTASWLLSCSAHEGGYGGFVMNTQGSGAGGWMQFMSGTFSWAFNHAKSAARAIIPPGAAAWTSPLGQAFAAGWARVAYLSGELARERTGWPWTGDPYCA